MYQKQAGLVGSSKVLYCVVWQAFGRIQSAVVDRWRTDARGTRTPTGMGRRPTFAELFIALKPLTYFAAAPPRKVTDSACSLPARRHCLFNQAAALIKVVDTLPRIPCTKCSFHFRN